MAWAQLHSRPAGLAEDVVIAVEALSRAAPRPDPQPPRWLARVLPGVQWSAAGDFSDADDEDDLEDYEFLPKGRAALQAVSFELRPGEGLGLVGDPVATKTVLSLLVGLYPPSSGRVVVRGRIAPLLRHSELNFSGYTGRPSLKVISAFLGWPSGFLKSRWAEIEAFAHLEEVDDLGLPRDSLEYLEACDKRLLLAAVMHLEASVYAVQKSFAGTDEVMYDRCCDLLQQRQAEGCAIVQVGKAPDDVARFCSEAILFEDGAPVFQGRLSAVAATVEDRRFAASLKRPRAPSMPMQARLLDHTTPVAIGPDGGAIHVELDVYRDKTAILRLRFVDQSGREFEIDDPELFVATTGVYRARISIPGGLLDSGLYTATLFGASARERLGNSDIQTPSGEWIPDDRPPPPPVRLLSFEVSCETGDLDATPEFGVFVDDGVGSPSDVEWRVDRVER